MYSGVPLLGNIFIVVSMSKPIGARARTMLGLISAGILEQSNGAGNRVAVSYVAWRNRFLATDSWSPEKFENTISCQCFSDYAADFQWRQICCFATAP
jgi:hypothetical protein